MTTQSYTVGELGGGTCSNLAEQLRDISLPSGWNILRHLRSFSRKMLGEGDAEEGDARDGDARDGDAGGLDP